MHLATGIHNQSWQMNKYIIHIMKGYIFLYPMMFHFIRPGIIEIMNLKLIFSLLYFEHQYLSYYIQYYIQY